MGRSRERREKGRNVKNPSPSSSTRGHRDRGRPRTRSPSKSDRDERKVTKDDKSRDRERERVRTPLDSDGDQRKVKTDKSRHRGRPRTRSPSKSDGDEGKVTKNDKSRDRERERVRTPLDSDGKVKTETDKSRDRGRPRTRSPPKSDGDERKVTKDDKSRDRGRVSTPLDSDGDQRKVKTDKSRHRGRPRSRSPPKSDSGDERKVMKDDKSRDRERERVRTPLDSDGDQRKVKTETDKSRHRGRDEKRKAERKGRRTPTGDEEEGEISDGSDDEVGRVKEEPQIKRYWGDEIVSSSSSSRNRYYELDEERDRRSSRHRRERSPVGNSRGRGRERGADLRDELDAMEKGELTDKRAPRRGRREDDGEELQRKRPRKDGTPNVDASTEEPPEEIKRKPQLDEVLTRTGGAYIPPAKLRMMQKDLADKSSITYQRIAWEALKKSINGLINKVNTSNVGIIVRELFKENLVRGRGVLCRSIMQAQSASPTFTNVYAALVAIINTKFPNIGELILKRLIIQFRRGYTRNDKPACLAAASFIGHLVNQQVAHEVLALEILTLLLEHPTEDSVQVAIAFLKEVGARIDEVSPKGAHYIFERLRNVLNEATLDKRVQYMIEVMFQVRKDKFKDFVSVPEDLDLVEEEEQFTHLVTLDEATDGQDILNVFKADTEYLENEEKYMSLRKEILDESENDEDGDEEDDDGEDEDEEGGEVPDAGTILDRTETNLLGLRKTIYLTIQSSLDFEECCHKLLKMNMQDGQEIELCHMILDCCAQQRTYEKFFGLLAGRFCSINMKYVAPFEAIFKDTYDTVHRLDTNKLRNVSKFFAHLLFTDSFSWGVLQCIRLTEDDTTSSSRIFVKILFQELSEYMGLNKLNERITDPSLSYCFDGLFPRDHPKNTRFAINFFTSIGLGGLTDELREHLKRHPKPTAVVAPQEITPSKAVVKEESESSDESSPSSSSTSSSSTSSLTSSSSSSSSSDSSSSESESEDSDPPPKRKRKAKRSSLEKRKSVRKLHEEKKRTPKSKIEKRRDESPDRMEISSTRGNRRSERMDRSRSPMIQSRAQDRARDRSRSPMIQSRAQDRARDRSRSPMIQSRAQDRARDRSRSPMIQSRAQDRARDRSRSPMIQSRAEDRARDRSSPSSRRGKDPVRDRSPSRGKGRDPARDRRSASSGKGRNPVRDRSSPTNRRDRESRDLMIRDRSSPSSRRGKDPVLDRSPSSEKGRESVRDRSSPTNRRDRESRNPIITDRSSPSSRRGKDPTRDKSSPSSRRDRRDPVRDRSSPSGRRGRDYDRK